MEKRPRLDSLTSAPEKDECASGVKWDACESRPLICTATSSGCRSIGQEVDFREVVEDLAQPDGFGRAAAAGMEAT